MPSPIDLLIRIRSDVSSATRGVGQATTAADKFKTGVKGMGIAAGAALGGLVALGKVAAEAASRQEQAFGSLESVYGKQSKAQQALAEGAAKTTGLSAAQYAEMSAKLGASLKNMGLSQDQAGAKSKELIGLGADLSAAFGGSSADAVDALGAALRGEADPAERYGLALSQTAINAELARTGQDKLTGSALQSAKAAAILALAHKQAGGAIGQFSRESGGAAGSAQIAAAQFENTKAALGQALLPVLVAVSAALSGFATFLGQNIGLVTTIAAVVGGFAAAIIAVNVAMTIYSSVQKLMAAGTAIATAAQWLWNAALSANPIALIVIAIAAFVAAIVVLFNKSEGFRNFVLGMWAAIQAAAQAAWTAIQTAIGAVLTFITTAAQALGAAVVAVWTAIQTAAAAVWTAIQVAIAAVLAFIVATAQGLGRAVVAVWQAIQTAAAAVWAAIQTAIAAVLGAITSAAQALGRAVATVWDGIKTAASTVWNAVLSIITGIIEKVRGAWQAFVNGFSALIDGIKTAVRTVFDGVKQIVQDVVTGIGIIITGITTAAQKVWDTVKTGAQTAWTLIKSYIITPLTEAMNWITTTFGTVATFFSNLWTGILNTATTILGGIGSAVSGAFNGVVNVVKGVLNGVIGFINSYAIGPLNFLIDQANKIPFVNIGHIPNVPVIASYGGITGADGSALSGLVAGAIHRSIDASTSVTVTGALDPDATARRIQGLLTARSRRTGITVLGGAY